MCIRCKQIIARPYTGRVDHSESDLRSLLEQGYTTVTWVSSSNSMCADCSILNGQTWELQEFMNTVEFSAPIFCKSHPNCLCHIIVTHPNGASVNVNWEGIML